MARFAAKHLVFLLLTLFVVSFLVFALNEYSPGDVARKELGAYATQDQVESLTKRLGLDRPLLVRYAEYMGKAAVGDLGTSARYKAPVRTVIARHLANTALLAALAFACIVPLSMALGIAAGNATINPITVTLLQINYLVAGVVVVETVFAYPGFGRMMLEAALFKDIALVEAGALVAVGLAVVTNVLGDAAYMLLDPRIRA